MILDNEKRITPLYNKKGETTLNSFSANRESLLIASLL